MPVVLSAFSGGPVRAADVYLCVRQTLGVYPGGGRFPGADTEVGAQARSGTAQE